MPTVVLYHVSDRGDIDQFEPRPTPTSTSDNDTALVWAVDAAHLPNYLLPRDCPRVTFAANATTTAHDRDRWLGAARRVVAVESRWYDRVRRARLFCYRMPTERFELLDQHAGYYVARDAVTPLWMTTIDDALQALLDHDVEVRFMPNLWPLHHAIVASTVEFSSIRMRNARPDEGASGGR